MEVRLPLSSALENVHVHPLLSSLLPIQPRIEVLERLMLLSPASKALKRLGIPDAVIVLSALGSAVATALHYRNHVRLILGIAGAAEGLARTIRLLARIDSDGDDGDGQGTKDEAKHVLSWWILYAIVSLSTMRSRTSKTAMRVPPAISRILRRYALMNYPKFPQPYAVPSPATPLDPTQKLKRELIKLAVLWTGLRTDGTGASIIWDWIVGPVFAVSRKRHPRRRTVVVRRYETDDEELMEARVNHPLATSTPVTNNSTTRTVHYSSSDASDDSTHHDMVAGEDSVTADSFPTPQHVPFRMTSLLNPVLQKKGSEDVTHELARWD